MRALILAAALAVGACATPPVLPQNPETAAFSEGAVLQVLMDQQDAWNRGDIPGFMEGYWNSNDLRFASGGTITRGWQTTLDRYLARYDTPEKMGELAFTEMVVTPAGPRDALVFGRWTLKRENDAPTGYFTLHLKRFEDGWKVVSDHTSSG